MAKQGRRIRRFRREKRRQPAPLRAAAWLTPSRIATAISTLAGVVALVRALLHND